MGERPIVLEGANPLLIASVIVLGVGVVLLWVGPGIGAVSRARAAIAEKQERFAAWDEQREAADGVSEAERARWSTDFDRVRTFGESAPDEASLTARVARRLSAPSVRGLEVVRNGSVDDAESEEGPVELRQPFGKKVLEFRRVPLRVRFDASYSDVKWILEGLAPENSGGMTLHRVELKRRFPEVRVELEMDVWTREELES